MGPQAPPTAAAACAMNRATSAAGPSYGLPGQPSYAKACIYKRKTNGKIPSKGKQNVPSVMHFYSGQLMQFYSGVDNLQSHLLAPVGIRVRHHLAGLVPRVSTILEKRKSLKLWSERQNARVCQRNPSNSIACDAIQRQRCSGWERDWYLTSIASDRLIAAATERRVLALTSRTGVGAAS